VQLLPSHQSLDRNPLLLPAMLWLVVVVSGILFRPLMAVDETRYLSVAWEMWNSGNFLVPHLDGATYAHKPPLLFWLVDAAWAAFGVHEWVARLIPALFGLGAIYMVQRMARLLWPEDAAAQRLAPLILAGTGSAALYGSLTMFDLMLTFFVLLGIEGAVRAWRGSGWGWLVCGCALGCALLSKGPVALLHALPVLLLAPLWMKEGPKEGWVRCYASTLGAVALAGAIALAWALPAADAGGEAYARELLWGQTADRLVAASAHSRPLWWYLPILPALLFPWIFVPRLWRSARIGRDPGEVLCFIWLASALIAFSLISGKQAHYLLPETAPAALLAARWLNGMRIERLAAVAPSLLAVGNGAFLTPYLAPYDVSAAATYVAEAARAGRPIGRASDYEGEFNFLARVSQPFHVAREPSEILAWAAANPGGLYFVTIRSRPGAMVWQPEMTFPYRDRTVTLWSAAVILESGGRAIGRPYGG
jgi:4-amino-4-deoxy-L-arabinose transferase-like glycosyltransferase